MLFHRSIGENISYAKNNASSQEIEDAEKKAHIDDFIKKLPQGYETLVGERNSHKQPIKSSHYQKMREMQAGEASQTT